MKKGDFIWGLVLLGIVVFLIMPQTHEIFTQLSKAHPYLMAFIKFGILSTMGELLALRIVNKRWEKPVGIHLKAIVWGFIGMLIAMIFVLYDSGVTTLIEKHYLPSIGDGVTAMFFKAFFTSALMNLLFAPTFMSFHRVTDTWIELGEGKIEKIIKVKFLTVLKTVDWSSFISFAVCKTIPIFWIPAHTITFILPSEYRVLAAAMLSIVLGAILGYSKSKKASF